MSDFLKTIGKDLGPVYEKLCLNGQNHFFTKFKQKHEQTLSNVV